MSAISAPMRGSAVRAAPARARTPTAPVTPGASAPPLRVVPRVRRRHVLAYLLLVCAILAGAVFGVVGLSAAAAGTAVEARDLQTRIDAHERAYGQLVAQVAALEDPARIRDIAHEQGLVQASSFRHLQVERPLPADRAVANGRSGTVRGIDAYTTDRVKSVLSLGAG
ncbi:MAG: hypothetical protein WDZ26_02115 [Nitriliruptoraceae bacterium]